MDENGDDRPDGSRGAGAAGMTAVRPRRRVHAGEVGVLETRYPPGLEIDRHRHDRTGVTLVLAGRLVERTAAGVHRAGPGSVVVKPGGTEHADSFGDTGARLLLLDLGERGAPTEELTDRGWQWNDGGGPARALLRIAEALRLWPEELDRVVEETVQRLPGLVDGEESGTDDDPPGWLRDVRRRLHRQLRDPPLVREMAADADVHPTHLTRRFKRAYGNTVTGYVRRLRAREAARLIASGDEPLAGVAYRVGFSDQSHMCRVFRRELGLTPGRYRDLL